MKNRWLLINGGLLLLLGIAIVSISDDSLFLWFNKHITPISAGPFSILTMAGEALFGLVLGGMIWIFKSRREALIFGLAVIVASLVTQLLKQTIFSEMARPLAHFEAMGTELFLPAGIKFNKWNSFPSGHTTGIFAMMSFVVLRYQLPRTFWPAFALAWLVALSRIVLVQHFFSDVLAGAMIGTATAWIVAEKIKYKQPSNQ